VEWFVVFKGHCPFFVPSFRKHLFFYTLQLGLHNSHFGHFGSNCSENTQPLTDVTFDKPKTRMGNGRVKKININVWQT
jgi:hypothetical protein